MSNLAFRMISSSARVSSGSLQAAFDLMASKHPANQKDGTTYEKLVGVCENPIGTSPLSPFTNVGLASMRPALRIPITFGLSARNTGEPLAPPMLIRLITNEWGAWQTNGRTALITPRCKNGPN